jgi:hypothetical protein
LKTGASFVGGVRWWLILTGLFGPGLARAADTGEPMATEGRLAEAFRRGFADTASNSEPSLEVARHGSSAVITGRSGDERIELVCLLCDGAELVSTARAVGAQLAAASGGDQPARLTVGGLDPSDLLLVDGFPAGLPEQVIEPGEHQVVVARGDARRARSLTLDPGEHLQSSFEQLEAVDDGGPALRAAVLLGGLGVAAAAAGTALVLLDDRCASTQVDAAGHCAKLHDTGPAGWALVGVGAASLIAGLIVLIVDRAAGDDEEPPLEDER